MINRTRVTVDEATREVLDQLSTELARAPSWTQQLSDDLQQAFVETFSDAQAAQARALEPIAASGCALQAQLGRQADLLGGVEARLQALDGRLDGFERLLAEVRATQARLLADAGATRDEVLRQEATLEAARSDLAARTEALQAESSGQVERLAAVRAAIGVLDERLAQQAPSVDRLVQEVARLAELSAQGGVQATEQRRELDALRRDHQAMASRQDAAQDALAGLLKDAVAMLQDVGQRQATQHEALQQLAQGLDSLNRPWWRRLFLSSRSAKS